MKEIEQLVFTQLMQMVEDGLVNISMDDEGELYFYLATNK